MVTRVVVSMVLDVCVMQSEYSVDLCLAIASLAATYNLVNG